MAAVRVPGVKMIIAGHGPLAMPPSIAFLTSRWTAPDAVTGLPIALIAALHLAALGLVWSEVGFVPKVVFCLTWGLFNFFWLAVLRRPALSATLSLLMIVVLILLSRLKYDIIRMTANFLDVMIINTDTIRFLLSMKPNLYREVLLALALTPPTLALLWRSDSLRVRLRTAAIASTAVAPTAACRLVAPSQEW
jgi:hypothetical protein